MNFTDLARARAATLRKRPAEVVDAQPIRLTAVRPVSRHTPAPRPAAVAPGTIARFHAWRRDHYVADQALRVIALLVGALLILALVIGLVAWAIRYIAGQLSPVLGAVGGLAGVAVLALVVVVLVKLAGGKSDGHSSGYGFHYGKCK